MSSEAKSGETIWCTSSDSETWSAQYWFRLGGFASIKRRPVAGLLPLDLLAVTGFDVSIGEGEIYALNAISDRVTGPGVGDVGVLGSLGEA